MRGDPHRHRAALRGRRSGLVPGAGVRRGVRHLRDVRAVHTAGAAGWLGSWCGGVWWRRRSPSHQLQTVERVSLITTNSCDFYRRRQSNKNKRMKRFELSTLSLARRCSTTELHPQVDARGVSLATREACSTEGPWVKPKRWARSVKVSPAVTGPCAGATHLCGDLKWVRRKSQPPQQQQFRGDCRFFGRPNRTHQLLKTPVRVL